MSRIFEFNVSSSEEIASRIVKKVREQVSHTFPEEASEAPQQFADNEPTIVTSPPHLISVNERRAPAFPSAPRKRPHTALVAIFILAVLAGIYCLAELHWFR